MIRRIGRYEITGKLGDGGFGSVYQGYDPTVERVVAIKVLSTQGDASLINRFRTEAMTAGNLHHKNIVTIYEFGEDNGAPFLAMEYLDGIDLQKIISNKSERESLTLLEKLEIMFEAAQGLQCAHENGVVHRDVKPANIMRLKDGSVKIMDFGIARLTNTAATRLTQTGLLIGTVYYMSPEQFKSAEVDALCDIWSYGVVFYEFLTGVHPFRADDPAGAMYRITMEEPASVNSLVPECPPALAVNLHRLLSKDRHNRIQSLDDFLLDTEPVIASLAKIDLPELLKRAKRLIDEDNIDGAQPVVGRLLKLDRSNKEVRQLREQFRERARLQAVRPKIEALLREAEERAGNKDFPAAVEKLNSAMRLDPGNPTLRSQLERIKGEEERAKRADIAASRGRRSLNEGDLTGAFAHLSEALETEPSHDQASSLLDEVKRALHDREIQAQIKAVMGQANDLIFIQAYDDAIALLADLSEKASSDEQVVRRLVEARQLKQAQETKDKLNSGINASRELLKRGSYEQACRALEELDRENPSSPAIEVLLTHARERLRAEKLTNEIETILAQARGQRASGRFDAALQCVQRALILDPGNAKALTLQRIYLDEAQADHDRKKIDAELEQYQALLKQEKLEEARALVDRLAAEHPGEPRIAGAKVEAAERIEKKEEARRLKVQKGIHEAERLLADARPESATRLLTNLTIQFPAEAAVHDLLDRARRLKLSQEAQDRLNAGLNSAQQFLTSGNFAQACQALEDLDLQYPQNAAIEVLLTHARDRMKAAAVSAQIDKFLGEAQDQQAHGQFDPALVCVERALELDPANNRALALKATLFEEGRAYRDHGKIAAELEKLQAFLREGQLDRAFAAIEQLATLFPQDPRVVEAKRDIAKRIRERNEQRAREIRERVKESERMLADGRAANARHLLKNLALQFPDELSLPSLLERASQLERDQALREEIRKNVAVVREFASRREWDQTLALIDKALEQQPECFEYLEQAENIRQLRRCDQELSAVESALQSGPPEQAISMAEAAVAKYPGEPRATAALQTARNLRELNDLVVYARRRVANGDLDEARQLVTDGRTRFPGSSELQEIESAIESARGLEQSLHNARQALQTWRFDEARKLVKPLLRAHPENVAARQLLEEVETQQKEYERQESYDRGRREAESLLRNLRFGSAIDKLQQLLLNFPGDTALREDMERMCAARDQHAKREKYALGLAESRKLSEVGNLVEAIARIQSLLEEFPGDSALMADLETIRAAKLLREERIRMDALIAELDTPFRTGDAQAVQRGAKEILSHTREPRASELLSWAERSLAQTREIRKKGRTRSPLALWGGIGSLVLAGAAIFFWPPSKEIMVQPAEIVFSYQKGGPVPKSQPVHIKAGRPTQSWRVTKADSWLQISRISGTGTSDLDIRIDPLELSPGKYTSVASVSSDSQQKTVKVRLAVTDLEVTKREPKKDRPTTTTALTSSSNPSTYGESVVLRGTLSPPGATGTVTFKEGSAILGVGTLAGGMATITLTTLSAGSHSLTVLYGGDKNYAGSRSALTESVKALSTTTMLTSSPNPSIYGQSVTLVAAVSHSAATGTVTFYDGANANVLGSGTLKSGTANMTSATLSVGLHSLIAMYSGDGNYSGSRYASTHTVNPAFAPVDCFAPNYTGVRAGKFSWKGELAPGGIVTINNGSAQPPGPVIGRAFPGCPVTVTSQTEGVVVLEQPGSMDSYRQIRLTNKSGQPINSITIQWDVKR